MVLIQPEKRLIIWQDPFGSCACLDSLDSDYNIDGQLGSAHYNDVRQAFSYFANEGKIEPKGWKQVEGEVKDFKQTFNKKREDYYGSL